MARRNLELLMSVALLLCALALAERGWERAAQAQVEKQRRNPVVVIDPGHGGSDPGKIGVDGCLEKEINLTIAKKVRAMLEAQDVEVILTREEDVGLYEEGSSNKKAQDLKNRCARIDEEQPDCAVSIHQNSYHEESVSGAQVFYYGSSGEAKVLAETLQAKLSSWLDPENRRQAKANESYYLLKKTTAPIVIVECGFLSNWEECRLLEEEDYQSQVAWAVAMGVLEYLARAPGVG